MIPEKLVEFIQGPTFMFVGTRDEKLSTSVKRAFGAIVNQHRETITFFVPEIMSEKMLRNLDDNGRVALTMAQMPSHETYQFKGAYISSRKSNDKEIAIQDVYCDKMVLVVEMVGFPEEFWTSYVYKPSVAVTFQVEDIFDQTPSPEAGKKITSD